MRFGISIKYKFEWNFGNATKNLWHGSLLESVAISSFPWNIFEMLSFSSSLIYFQLFMPHLLSGLSFSFLLLLLFFLFVDKH